MNGLLTDEFSGTNQFMAFPLVFRHYFLARKPFAYVILSYNIMIETDQDLDK